MGGPGPPGQLGLPGDDGRPGLKGMSKIFACYIIYYLNRFYPHVASTNRGIIDVLRHLCFSL